MSEQTGTVIVVDDDEAVRQSLKFALELEALTVRVYGGGAQLLAGVRRQYILDTDLQQGVAGIAEQAASRFVRVEEPSLAVGDEQARRGGGVIHKYNGRALLIATGSCAIHCRYCFRRHYPYAEDTAAAAGWREAVALIADDASIHEVILSGGDPLSLADHKLAELTAALRDIPHLRRLRLHTRLPIVLPERVDAGLLAWLRGLPWPVAIVVHANHANEFDGTVDTAMAALRETGATLLNQVR